MASPDLELAEAPAEVAPGVRRASASAVIGALAAIGGFSVVLLGFLGSLPEEIEPEVGRLVFVNIPGWLQVVFYLTTATFVGLAGALFSLRARSWERGRADPRVGRWADRLRRLFQGLTMQTLLRDRAAGLMHTMIYVGFLVLFAGTVTLEIEHLLPNNLKFLYGNFYLGYSLILDLVSLVFLGGLAWAFVRRYLQRPWRLRSKTKPEDAWNLAVLTALGVTGLTTEAARISLSGRPRSSAGRWWGFLSHR